MRDVRVRGTLSNQVGQLFRRLARVHNRMLRPFEISAVQANILSILWESGAMTIGELQAELAIGSSTLTGAVDRMERVGLVRREDHPRDRRAIRLVPVT